MKAEIHHLNICFNRPEKEGEFADKIRDTLFVCYSLDNARFPEFAILPPGNSQELFAEEES